MELAQDTVASILTLSPRNSGLVLHYTILKRTRIVQVVQSRISMNEKQEYSAGKYIRITNEPSLHIRIHSLEIVHYGISWHGGLESA